MNIYGLYFNLRKQNYYVQFRLFNSFWQLFLSKVFDDFCNMGWGNVVFFSWLLVLMDFRVV